MKGKRRRGVAFAVVAAAVVLLPEFFIERTRYAIIDGFGFYAWFGWATCLLMVLAALLVGRAVKCRDDYYDD